MNHIELHYLYENSIKKSMNEIVFTLRCIITNEKNQSLFSCNFTNTSNIFFQCKDYTAMCAHRMNWKIVRHFIRTKSCHLNCVRAMLRHVLLESKVSHQLRYVFISLFLIEKRSKIRIISFIALFLTMKSQFNHSMNTQTRFLNELRILDGITIRGCLPHHQQTLCNTDSCSFCRSNKCNSQIFPEDRLNCLHCEGSSCVNQTNTIDVRYPCAKYDADDECYSIFSYGKKDHDFVSMH